MKAIIGLDVDGVIRDIYSPLLSIIEDMYPGSVKSKVISGYDFPNIDLPLETILNVMFSLCSKEIFEDSLAYNGAYDDFITLLEWTKENDCKLVCATHQQHEIIHHTLIWLGKHRFNFEEIYISGEKEKLPIDFLIDDSAKNFEAWSLSDKTPNNFILVNRDWNLDCKVENRIFNVKEAIPIIKKNLNL